MWLVCGGLARGVGCLREHWGLISGIVMREAKGMVSVCGLMERGVVCGAWGAEKWD